MPEAERPILKGVLSLLHTAVQGERQHWRNDCIPKAVQIYNFFLTYRITWYLLVDFNQIRSCLLTFCKVKVEKDCGLWGAVDMEERERTAPCLV